MLVKSTKPYLPWIVIHTEKYSIRAEAMKREKELKSHQGRNFIRENFIPVQLSWLEQRTVNPRVASSSLATGAPLEPLFCNGGFLVVVHPQPNHIYPNQVKYMATMDKKTMDTFTKKTTKPFVI